MAGKKDAVEEKRTWKQSLYEWAEAVTIALLVVVLLFTFLFRLVGVEGTSMMTTLHDGERLILSRLPYTPERGDIVVIDRGGSEEPLIKRVIGIAGDTVEVDELGGVWLNGEQQKEAYVNCPTAQENMIRPVTVPDGYVFVMGDNRAHGCSFDSRYFGCIPQETLIGKAVFRVFPLNRFGGIYDEL